MPWEYGGREGSSAGRMYPGAGGHQEWLGTWVVLRQKGPVLGRSDLGTWHMRRAGRRGREGQAGTITGKQEMCQAGAQQTAEERGRGRGSLCLFL